MSKWLLTFILLICSTILTRLIPFSDFFRMLNTMVHEFGHAIATVVLAGKVIYVQLFPDLSGVTYSSIRQDWRLIVVSVAGYTSASLFTLYLFSEFTKGKLKRGLFVLTFISVISLLFFVRNEYGVYWLLVFIVLNIIMQWIPYLTVRNIYYVLLSFLMLEESVLSCVQLLFISLSTPLEAGDATNLSKVALFSPVLWSILFLIFALWCAMQSIKLFVDWKPRKGYQAK